MLLNLALLGNGDVNKGLKVATAAVNDAAAGGQGGRRERFTASGASSESTSLGIGIGVVATYIVLYVIWMLISSFAAARLSWTYNIYLGNSVGWALLYSILAFFFSEIYFVFYALVFNPLSGKGGNSRRNNANRIPNL